MRFIENGPSIPDELLNARDEGRVVFFCGAGVSQARAGLPLFFHLADAVIRSLGVSKNDDARWLLDKARELGKERNIAGLISADRVFGLLERQFPSAEIHAAVAKALKPVDNVNLSAHKILLRLAKTPESKTRLVTTNLDTLFDSCEKGLEFHQPTRLPNRSRYNDLDGVVYLHGRVNEDYSGADEAGFVLSSSEFGHAYLSEGWATEFCREIFRDYDVVFVGYSADDPPIHYLLEGLARSHNSSRRIYAFQAGESEEVAALWGHKNVEAISYAAIANDHSALWKTLELWARRADDSDRWRQAVINRAADGPESLKPHERGQVAHVVSTYEGAREFANSKPPAEWLCVFDPACRYAVRARSSWPDTAGPVASPFSLYGLDSDVTPERSDPDSPYARTDVPTEAWDAFEANALDRQKPSDERLAAFRGDYATHFPRLPRRLECLAGWLMQIVGQPAAVWWAVRQKTLHPGVRAGIERQLGVRADEIDPVLRQTWRHLLEAWKHADDRPEWNWHDLKNEIKQGGWGASVVRRFVGMTEPNLTASPGYSSGPEPPKRDTNVRVKDLVRFAVECPDLPENVPVSDEWLELLIRGLRKNLELAARLCEEVDDGHAQMICPIVPDSSPDISKHQRKHGLSGYVIRFASLFERLAKLDPAKAQKEMAAWSDDDTVFCRLRIWAGGKAEVTTAQAFSQIVSELSDRAFWDGYHQRDLLLALAARWGDLPEGDCKQIEKRLLEGPVRWDDEDEALYKERRARRTLPRLQWLADNGCEFSFDLKEEIAERRLSAPDWEPENARQAVASREMRGGFVATDTKHESLLLGPIDTVLSRARKLSGRAAGNRLEERDPFAGLCEKHAARALEALVHAAEGAGYPKWAWTTFFERFDAEENGPELLKEVAQSVCGFPEETLAELLHPSTSWLEKAAKSLSQHAPDRFDEVVSILVATLRLEPSRGLSAVLDTGENRDWVTQAISFPAGELAQALLADSRIEISKGEYSLSTAWLDQLKGLLDLEGDSRRYAIAVVARDTGWLHHHAPEWTDEQLLSILDAEDADDREALWDGILWTADVASAELYQRLKPSLLTIVADGEPSREGHVESLAYLVLQGWISIGAGERARQVSNIEFREALLEGGSDFRSQVLWLLGNMLREKEGKDRKETALAIEFFRDVWPRQRSVKTPEMSARVCEVLIDSGAGFAELAEVVLPLLTKMQRHGINLHFRSEVDTVITAHPKLFLEMLYMVLPDDVRGWPYGIEEILEKLIAADGDLVKDARFVELKRKWDAR
jgi:SIR2-like protein